MKDRDDRSRGIDTLIVDDFVIIKPTVPFRLTKHEAPRKRNLPDSSGKSLVKTDALRCEFKKINLIKSSYRHPVVSTVRN